MKNLRTKIGAILAASLCGCAHNIVSDFEARFDNVVTIAELIALPSDPQTPLYEIRTTDTRAIKEALSCVTVSVDDLPLYECIFEVE